MAFRMKRVGEDASISHHTDISGHNRITSFSKPNLASSDTLETLLRSDRADSSRHSAIRRYRCTGQWVWEILAVVFSTVCLVVVTAALLVMNDRRLMDWKLPISPNALVSIFVTLSKSSLLMLTAEGISQLKWKYLAETTRRLYDLQIFDDASRGPWGALKLLITCKSKPALAYIGAIITVVALAMDPFAQQILESRSVMMASADDMAVIRTATAYEVAVREGSGPSAFAGIDLILNMTNSIYAGMFHGTSKSQVEHICSTANCTWDTFQSLGVCSQCTNETDLATGTCLSSNITGSAGLVTNTEQNCTYTTPNGTALEASTSYDPDTRAHNSTVLQTVVESQALVDGNLSARLATISIIRLGPQLEWYLPWPAIYTCEISPCQKMFLPSVINGSLFDTVIDEQPTNFSHCHSETDASHCAALPMGETSNMSTIEDPSAMWISTEAITSMRTLIKTLLTHTNSNIGMKRLAASPGALMTSMLWKLNNGNIMQTIDDIATAMTNQIREGPNSTWVQGKAMTPTVVVHVNWWFFSLPVMVLLLAVTFLVTLILTSRDANTPVWKSSILGMVFLQLDVRTLGDRNVVSLHEMELAAMETEVSIRRDIVT
ncbi:uncharacterized protein RCC_03699 [Ramularia collo-cygni]|uniref:Uncharacterized protein n=1 Tax=Ramularia collo-cygni TaxID=112498 RepID=A0A2D3VBL4_9PEZI|nr:uncharacterized protein RCC_03699 [Ramularia collo-cygni]CZT17863.1 uncharacterized protein RCC_03699 [Ramularia collo-cygni]